MLGITRSEPQNYNLDKFYYFPRNKFPKTTKQN